MRLSEKVDEHSKQHMKKIKREWHLQGCAETGKGECDCVIEMRDTARVLAKGYDRGIRRAYEGVAAFLRAKVEEGLVEKEVLDQFLQYVGKACGQKKNKVIK